MNYHIITLFPDSFRSYLGESILKRAIEDKKISVKFYNPRDFSDNDYRRIDQRPYGGGPGMVIQALPVLKAIEVALRKSEALNSKFEINSKSRKLKNRIKLKVKIIWLSPSGKQFDTEYAKKTAEKYTDIIIVCGRYEGIDARVKKVFKMEEISVGPFVLTGGELPAMIMIDCISRQVEGVLGNFDSREEERVSSSDVYTRPEVLTYKGKKFRVPKILLSGNHAKITNWRSRNK